MSSHKIDNVTVFSDASFCPETKAAGGAFWARGNLFKESAAFSIEGAIRSHDAEMMAACSAILRVAQHQQLGKMLANGPQTRLVLVIDCLAIKQVLSEGKMVHLSGAAREAVTQVRSLLSNLRFLLQVNHVKAHQGDSTPRQWVNQWCDENARKHMKKARASVRKLNFSAEKT